MPKTYALGPFRLDGEAEILYRGTEPIAVGQRAVALLRVLVEQAGAPVAKHALIEAAWPGLAVEDSNLTVQIAALRRVFAEEAGGQRWIETLPRRGYRFVGPLDSDAPNHDAENAPPQQQPNAPSIAVLPFGNLSDDPEQSYFSDGMAEDLITDLSKISGIFVAARHSAFAFRDQAVDVRDIAARLGVRHILEGSVRKMGPKLRVNVQLIDAESGGHIWAERYDGDLADIFAFQDDIREQIVSALRVRLTATDRARARLKQTDSVAAYDLFLRGRSNFHRFTPESLREAKSNLEEAIEIDPQFGDAYSYLSYCFFYGWFQRYPGFDDDLTRANQLAERGVALGGGSAVAIAHLGWIQTYSRRHDRAVENFAKAIALAPSDAEIHANFGQTLNYYGEPERALEMISKAFSLAIFAPPLWIFYEGHSHLLLHHYEEAVSRFLTAIDQIPKFTAAYFRLAVAYVEMDRIEEAADIVKSALEISPQYTLSVIADIYPYRLEKDRVRFFEGLRKAGVPE